jgi:hypothetical protein
VGLGGLHRVDAGPVDIEELFMTKDEALKLALEALVYASSYCNTYDAIDAVKQALAAPVPLTDEQIYAIGKELGMKCRLGGNPNIDLDYARAIESAHGITGENT